MEGSSKKENSRKLLWRPPRTASPVFRPYASQMELMRKRHNEEDNTGKSNRAFWVAWNDIQVRVSKYFANEEWDTQQFLAEVDLFKKLWPDELFPGQCPNRYYVSHLKHIEQKAYASGVQRSVFDHICEHIARCRFEDPEPDADIKQFQSESSLWNYFWPKEKFPGIHPYPNRAAQAPTSILSSRPAPLYVDYYNSSISLAEHQHFQEQVLAKGASERAEDNNNFVKQENKLPAKPLHNLPNTPHPSGSSGQIPAFATGANSVAGMPNPNTIDASYVSKLSNENAPAPPSAEESTLSPQPKPHVAGADSLLGYISKDLNLMAALEKALRCKISSGKVPGSTDQTWIFVEAWPEWEGCETEQRILDRAHSFVEKWCKLDLQEFFKLVTDAHDGDEGDQATTGKKRRMT